MPLVVCFWIEPAHRANLYLRRYSRDNGPDQCPKRPGNYSYHQEMILYAEVAENTIYDEKLERKVIQRDGPQTRNEVPANVMWPARCECGYEFLDTDHWQVFSRSLYLRPSNGQVLERDKFGPGAMWDCEWYHDTPFWCGSDGRSLMVILPNGHEWHIDGPCSNCTLPDDKTHKCWCRSGEIPKITVDKNCNTCSAGAGSILAGNYHGFLRDGVLVDA